MTRRLTLLASVLAAMLVVAACGSDGGGAAASSAPAQAKVVIKAGDTAPFTLDKGRYRFSWATTGCTDVAIDLAQQDGSYAYKKESTIPKFSTILVSVPAGTYTIDQTAAGCTDWQVTLERIPGS
jgi:hypothetical protein